MRKRNKYKSNRGINLFEMLFLLFILAAAITGASIGIELGARYNIWMKIIGGLLGTVVGGIAGVVGTYCIFYILFSPFLIIGAIRRAFEPTELVCCCNRKDTSVLEHLIPDTEIKKRAVSESNNVETWIKSQCIDSRGQINYEDMKHRLDDGLISRERIILTSTLGDSAASFFKYDSLEPISKSKLFHKNLPEDIQTVIRSGLPPKLAMIWMLSYVDRMLTIFENEFHQDTRPKQIVGAFLMVLRDNSLEALELCRGYSKKWWWDTKKAGCRVLRRPLRDRIKDRKSKGEIIGRAFNSIPNVIVDYMEPEMLWAVYKPRSMEDAYATPENRCNHAQPCVRVLRILDDLITASDDLDNELKWLREELLYLILNWSQWEEGCKDWQLRVENEWIPRIEANVKDRRFKTSDYIDRVQRELVPWKARKS